MQQPAKRRVRRTHKKLGPRRLTPQQAQILSLVMEGLTNPRIGDIMGLTEGTVKVYVHHIFHILGVSSRFELIMAVQRWDTSTKLAVGLMDAGIPDDPGEFQELFAEFRALGERERGAVRALIASLLPERIPIRLREPAATDRKDRGTS